MADKDTPRRSRRSITPARLYREIERVRDQHELKGFDTIDRLLEELVADVLADALGEVDTLGDTDD